MSQNQDIFGFYRVGDLKFYSKLEAIELSTKKNIHLHWDFNEPIFSSYDWTVEPAESLRELYKKRAQQIRDKYDYVIVSYSGGADSSNIVDSFVNNGIRIDELASHTNYEITGDKENFLNAEIFKVAFPNYEKLKASCPWMKFRNIDLSKPIVDTFEDSSIIDNWMYNLNSYRSPNMSVKDNLKMQIKEWRDIIESGKKLVIVHGIDKPRIMLENGKYVYKFLDLIDTAVTPLAQILNREWDYHELFYWTPDLPEIPIKQAHVVKNYVKNSAPDSLFMSYEKDYLGLAYRVLSDGKKLWLSNHGVHTLIYPDWDINTFSLGKTQSIILSSRDTWFWTESKQEKSVKNFYEALNKLWVNLPDYWKNEANDITRGTRLSYSKSYYLE